MRPPDQHSSSPPARRGSALIVVLWIILALVSITIYFAHSMALELKAAEERSAGLAADQAIEGAARYAAFVITNYATNGGFPMVGTYLASEIQVGEARAWFIGRDPNGVSNTVPNAAPVFGLVDEASKFNLNTVPTNVLLNITWMTTDLATGIGDWRSTNGGGTTTYGQGDRPYQDKNAPFETVDELNLVNGATPLLLAGEDINRNGVLDAEEYDENHNGYVDPGLIEYSTVYSQEPNTLTNGSARTLLSSGAAVSQLLNTTFGAGVAGALLPRAGRGGGPGYQSPLDLYVQSNMTADQFAQIANSLTTTNGQYIQGRINVNTASSLVLSCLPGLDPTTAQQLVNYRIANTNALGSVAWVADTLGKTSTAIQTLAAYDILTTVTYQIAADIAAVGPHGRGYRRVRFVFDTTTGLPQVVYRQDLSRLGWALGANARARSTSLSPSFQ